ncbi:MAG: Flp pilus assembly protein CpaB [Rubripirellula sp.]
MRNKSLYLLLACICGTAAAILAGQYLNAGPEAEGNSTEIFVATVAIDAGQEITPERVRLEQWPSDKVPQGSSGVFTDLEGKYAKQRFYVGEAIMPVKLMDDNWTTVPKGYRVVAMKASDVSIANLIQPGDRVDVMAYFNKSELVPRSMTKTVLMGVRVYALDGDTQRKVGEERPKSLRTIQLLIHEKDGEAWTYANELGNIRLSLGSDADYSSEDGSNEAGKEFLAWLEDHRKRQEEAVAQKEREARMKRQNMNQSKTTRSTPTVTKKDEDGFSMFKLVEGKMYEYWMVPGKLPELVGEVGGETNSKSGDSDGTSVMPADEEGTDEKTDGKEDPYSYLNGEDSPFYQPPNKGDADSAGR